MPDQTFKMLITDLGRAKLATAVANNAGINLTAMGIGDGAGVMVQPDPSQLALVRECYRAPLNRIFTTPDNPTLIIGELVVPIAVGGWVAREIGVFDTAGALIAVGNCGDTYKPTPAEGSTREMVIRVAMEVGNTDAVNLVIDATIVLATKDYVDSRTTSAAIIPGGNAAQVLAKASNADGDFTWISPTQVSAIIDAKQEQQTLAASQTVINFSTLTTAGTAVYIGGVRKYPTLDFSITSDTSITLLTAATSGQKLLAVQNNPTQALNFLGRASNLSDIADAAAARANLGLTDVAQTALADLARLVGATLFPVGTIHTSVSSANPATYFGFGTWARYANGQALFGVQENDADFATPQKAGGAKTTALTIDNLPAHSFEIATLTLTTAQSGNHKHTAAAAVNVSAAGNHKHSALILLGAGSDKNWRALENTASNLGIVGAQAGGGAGYREARGDGSQLLTTEGDHTHTASATVTISESGVHTHSLTIPKLTTNTLGKSLSFSRLPPYATVYFWRRTA
jgi:hypothetical protein